MRIYIGIGYNCLTLIEKLFAQMRVERERKKARELILGVYFF